jgi:hypothetical protein
MKLSPIFRTLAILSYLFIFLQGMMIAVPFGCMLLIGLFEAEPLTRILIILADLALLSLFILSFNQRNKNLLFIELIAYFLLLSPLVRILTIVPIEEFNYLLFIIPFTCFVVLYPLSVVFSFREYKRSRKTTGIDEGFM